ncbi:MAG TPA: primosomal protein N', partial [Anseongella sp.]|nr:primosomal protein N' [Anseongella sp.]
LDKEAIYVSEQMARGYKPKTAVYLELEEPYRDQEKLKELFNLLEKAPRQLDALMIYLRISRNKGPVSRKELMEESGVSSAVINSLAEKEIFRPVLKEVSRIKQEDTVPLQDYRFSEAQERALEETKSQLETKEGVLIHGVTSSGKTLLYIKLIEECLEKGQQVLYLLPEIAITEQMTERLRACFGSRLAVYHSRFNDNERGEIWKKVLDGGYGIILGARSALFLPFVNLGLVIIDEEHESSYKQFDPAPRYHARDSAVYLAGLHRAKTLLGSATPSLESYYNALQQKYGLVKLGERYGEVKLPETLVVDMLRETRQKTAHSHFSSVLMAELKTVLSNKKQAILFRNRRGYVPVTVCRTCGYIPQCIHCDISLTYHRSSEKLLCHYCGYSEKLLSTCPACGSAHLEQKGFGTEKVEDELKILLPEVRVARLDLDNTRSRNAFQQLLNDFEDGNIDILVGTQMVTKGLDFGNVALVGILDADSLFRYPDFRAFERSYQLMVQVSGRSGRRLERGKVIIQTSSPGHKIIRMVLENNYEAFYESEIAERGQFKYPPFFRLINVHLKHRDPDYLAGAAAGFAELLRSRLGSRVLGPQVPPVARVRNQYIRSLLIKIDRENDSLGKVKEILGVCLVQARARHKSLLIQVDVDPM